MISTRWLEKRKTYWARLELLVDRSNKGGISALDHRELQELGLLYRQTASDLATVREGRIMNRHSPSRDSRHGENEKGQ